MIARILMVFLLGTMTAFAQEKEALTHEDYNRWKRIQDQQISENGKTVVTTVVTGTGRGDGYIKIRNTETGITSTFINGYGSALSDDGRYVFFLQKPRYQQIRSEKKQGLKEPERTKPGFFIFDTHNNSVVDSVQRVSKFQIPKEQAEWVVIEKFKDLKAKDTLARKDQKKTRAKEKQEKPSTTAKYALVYHLKKRAIDTIFKIKEFKLPEQGDTFIFSTSEGEKGPDLGVFSYNTTRMSKTAIDTGQYSYKQLAIDNKGNQMAYLAARDSTQKDSLLHQLYYISGKDKVQVTDSLGRHLRDNWEVSTAQRPVFSEQGGRLFFHSRPVRHADMDTNLLEEEIPQVDVWSYHDALVQPEQKSRLKELRNRAYLSYYDTKDHSVVQLHDQSLEKILLDEDREQRYVLGSTSTPYRLERSWEYPWVKDYYIIDTRTGKKRMALEAQAMTPDLSPDGNYAVYFDMEDQNWWVLDLQKNQKRSLTGALAVAFYDEENDVPARPWPYGFGGFTDNGEVLLYDRYDIWRASLENTGQIENLTGNGRKTKTVYRTLRLDPEYRNQVSTYHGDFLVTSFDDSDKSEALYRIDPGSGRKQVLLEDGPYHLSGFELAEQEDNLLFRKENFTTYPDVYLLNEPDATPVQLTYANPQQKEYKWGSVELVSWKAFDGTSLDGLLFKPEDFDPEKKYPLMTYFYEKRSDNLHDYHSPQPSASIVNMSYLVSNDYVVFVPDIVYQEGKPGQSAYNAVVSGVEAIEKKGFIDSENMAIQGQSWGGYQVAYLVTVTDKFKAAMAGAPVSNMTSAYGGIRWGSGLSRAFQYEKTQSRIGKNLWEGLDLYIENSPLFGIPDIKTPLLMMHNDEDGAVPYYQGIEMFMGMRRLNKPAWLLVYNNEAHNLRKTKNRFDLSIRMMQFFDHYLKGAPAPEWMVEGVPAVEKGKDLGYDLLKSKNKSNSMLAQ